jgi:hypothetical protein
MLLLSNDRHGRIAGLAAATVIGGLIAASLLPVTFDAVAQEVSSCSVANPPAPFRDRGDVPAIHRENVDCAYNASIAQGFADGSYGPAGLVRRDQMASFVARALEAAGVGLPADRSQGYTDIDGNPHAANINRLAVADIVRGTSPTTYEPALRVRRDQMASFLLRAVAYAQEVPLSELESSTGTFNDVGDGNVHRLAINGAYELGLVQGGAGGTYSPFAHVRRDQMGSFLVRMLMHLFPQRMEALQTLIDDAAQQHEQDPPPEDERFGLEEDRDPDATVTVLAEAITALDALDPDQHEAARRHAAAAWEQLVGATTPDLVALVEVMGEVLRDLDGAAAAHEAASQFSQVAAVIAARLVDAAENGDRERVTEARETLQQGDRHHGTGAYLLAWEAYLEVVMLLADLQFDMDLFEGNITQALEGQTIGHSYVLVHPQETRRGRDGFARTAADEPATDQSWTKPMANASMSKTISAMVVLKLLQDQGRSVDDPIAPHLPSGWSHGPNVDTITFKQLLSHRSGLDPNKLTGPGGNAVPGLAGQSYQALQQLIAQGSTGASDGQASDYTNINYSLTRILIPNLYYGKDWIETHFAGHFANGDHDVIYGGIYTGTVIQKLLQLFGSGWSCGPRELPNARTRYYSMTTPTVSGVDHGSWCAGIGATGWHLSTAELTGLVAVQSVVSQQLFSAQTRGRMDAEYLGWLDPVEFAGLVDGVFGVYRSHGGDSASGPNPGMTGCMMKFPNGLRAALQINSRGGSIGGHPCTLLRDAFDNAWV